jgi:hypothetical protein
MARPRCNGCKDADKAQASNPRLSLAFALKMIMFWLSVKLSRKEKVIMALNICWLDDLAKAKNTARQTKKPVLLDFFNPQ